ncbi:recombinase family protein [Sporolactobacillus nakayamae]|uniref:Site-specific DNA recombinase n=1 Tax=Sporolactobacillus nakayamae TaxID=269670 RepID=A0A1I2VFT4_9BACL|nr:recombinase family protein [Sporolactobacillus nakayamae]SFG87047.1 Site-specific DNA recombinase [Sporolactobacillus nakayamae]
MTKRCAVYVRVSTDKEEQKKSLINQREIFENYIANRGWDLFKIYSDVQSGTKATKRPGFQQMLRDAKSHKFDIILAKELSRLARNGELSYRVLNSLQENSGIDIITLDGAINSLENQTSMFGLYAWVYENESQTMSRRIKYSFEVKARNGEFNGSIPPYGYTIVDKQLVLRNDFTVEVVQRIFKCYIAGQGFDHIARQLLKEKIPTSSQVAHKKNASSIWHGSTIKGILSNEHYIGNLVQQRETSISVTSTKRKKNVPDNVIRVEGTHEAIISKQNFDLVQQLLVQRSREHAHSKYHLFTSIAFCSDCGRGMHYKKNRKGYVCGSFDKHGHTLCSDHIIRESDLVDVITSDIKGLYTRISSKKFRDILDKRLQASESKRLKQIQQLKNKIETLSKEKNEALRLKIRSEITDEAYQDLVDENNTNISRFIATKEELENGSTNQVNEQQLNELFREIEHFIKHPTLNEEMLHRLIKKIEIKKDGSPRIYYRFSDPHLSFIFFQATHNIQRASSVGTYRLAAPFSLDTRLR